MASMHLGNVLRQIQRLYSGGSAAGVSDAALLDRFATERDEDAFAALVARHGPMTLAVCRGVLRDPGDVEDAFQATFLILARRVGSLRVQGSLAGWLHRVAYRVAVRANVDSARRRSRERQGVQMDAIAGRDGAAGDDRNSELHEEIARLPVAVRRAVVLCDLEGMTQMEAARELGCGEATVRRRLAGAHERLKRRLERSGSAGALGPLAAPLVRTDPIPPGWLEVAARAALAERLGHAATSAAGRLAAAVLSAMSRARQMKLLAFLVASAGLAMAWAALPGQSDGSPAAAAARPRQNQTANEPRPNGGSIAGVVLDHQGQPIAGADLINMGMSSAMVRQTKTGPDGRFRLDDLLEQTVGKEVLVRAKGSAPRRLKVEPGPPNRPAEVTITLEPGHRIKGRVDDEKGRPLAGVRVDFAHGDDPFSDGGRATTDDRGFFEFDSLPAQSPFGFSKKGYSAIEERHLPLDTDQVVSVTMAPAGVIAGRVVDVRTGKPIGAFRVQITFSPRRQPGEPSNGLFARLNDPGEMFQSNDGRFKLGELVVGMPLQVMVAAQGYERQVTERVVIARPDDGRVEEFRLDPVDPAELRTYRGRLVDARGNPVVAAQLRLFAARDRDPKERRSFPFNWAMIRSRQLAQVSTVTRFLQAATDAQGRFEFTLVPRRDEVELAWWGKGIAPGRSDHLERQEENESIEIKISPAARIIVTIDRKTFAGAGQIQVIGSEDSIDEVDRELKPGQTEIVLDDLAPGDYQVDLMSPDERVPGKPDELEARTLASTHATVGPGETKRVEFESASTPPPKAEITPRTKAILARLEEPVAMEFPDEVPLDDVLQHIERVTNKGPNDPGIPIYVDPLGVLEAGVFDSTVTINEKGLPLKDALARVLTPLGMAYIVKDDMLFISVPESTERQRNEVAVQACDASQQTKALVAQLEKPVKMPFPDDTPLGDVLEYLKQATEDLPQNRALEILVMPSGLEEAETTLNSTIQMDLEGVPLKTTLRLLLDQLGLACVVKDGRLVIHSSNGIRKLKTYVGGELPLPLATKPPPASEMTPRTKAILARLEEPVAMEFPSEVPLDDVLQHIKRATKNGPNDPGIPIYVDPLGLLEAGVLDSKLSIDEKAVVDLSWKTMARVKINEKGLPLKDILATVLTSLGLAYMVKDDVLVISDPESIQRERKELAVEICDASQETKALLARLEKPVRMPFSNSTPLGDVLEYLKRVPKDPRQGRAMEVLVFPSGLEEAHRTLNSTIRMDLDGVPLRTTLRLLLDQLGLGCVVKNGRLVIHSSNGIRKLKRNAAASRMAGMTWEAWPPERFLQDLTGPENFPTELQSPVEPSRAIACRAVDRDTSLPVAGAVVTLGVERRNDENGEVDPVTDLFVSHKTKTDQDGRFTVVVPEKYLAEPSPGRMLELRVTISHPRYVTYFDIADTREIAKNGISDTFPAFRAVKLLAARTLTGRLLGADGKPLPKVPIYKQYDLAAWPRDAELPVTGLDGRFRAKVPVHTALKLEFRTREAARIYHDVRPDQTDLGDVRVHRGEKVSGLVVDTLGKPVPWISMTIPSTPDAGTQPNLVYTTDDEGRFASDGLAPGTYLVKVGGIHRTEDGKDSSSVVKDAPGVYVPVPVVIRDGQTVRELTLRPVESVRFTATLVGPLPEARPEADRAQVRPPRGAPAALAAAYQTEPAIAVKGSYHGVEWASQYTFPAAAERPGTYTVRVPKGLTDATLVLDGLVLDMVKRFRLDSKSPELFGPAYHLGRVEADRPDIQIRPYRMTTISFIVSEPHPEQIKVTARYVREAEMRAAGVVFDSSPPHSPGTDGKLRLLVLPAEEIEIAATAPGNSKASARVKLTEGETRDLPLRFTKNEQE